MRKEPSDIMFVKCSQGRSQSSWDIQAVATSLEQNELWRGLDIGAFANAICELNSGIQVVDVVDPSIEAHENFIENSKTNLIKGTMESLPADVSYDFIIINLVCHHIISETNQSTVESQLSFLNQARSLLRRDGLLFVEENIYESYFQNDLCGRLIYEITSLKGIEPLTRKLGANTAGEGVRFHSDLAWRKIFQQAGLKIIQTFANTEWGSRMPIWQKIPLACKKRYQKMYVLAGEW